MNVIILAAGVGKRMKEFAGSIPKCLLEINGTNFLERHVNILSEYGIKEINLVVGYEQEKIRDKLSQYNGNLKINYVVNEIFSTSGSGYSLWLGLQNIKDEFMFMDADLLYDKRLISLLISSRHKDAMLLGGKIVDEEQVKILGENNRILKLGKNIEKGNMEIFGESVGIARISNDSRVALMKNMLSNVEKNDYDFEWEEILGGILPDINMQAVNTHDLFWIEVDFEEDYRKALNEYGKIQ